MNTEESNFQYDCRLSSSLSDNLNEILSCLGNSDDIEQSRYMEAKIPFTVLYLSGLVDEQQVNDYIIAPLLREQHIISQDYKINSLIEKMYGVKSFPLKTCSSVLKAIINGETVVLFDGFNEAVSMAGMKSKARTVEEPSTQTVIQGPKEAFVETLSINTSLIRRRIKNPNLRMKNYVIGMDTQTTITLCYIDEKVDKDVLDELHKRLSQLETKEIYDSGMLNEHLEKFGIKNRWYSPFPVNMSTERPDTIASSVNEGRVALIVDGSPFVSIYPVSFWTFFQAAEDYYQRFDFSSFIRVIRIISFLISLYLPSLYISVTTFHPELIATDLLINIAAQREGVPFPAFFEAILMELIFEILREGGIRMPRAIGPAISIVGAIVLGDSIVRAGLVSPVIVIIVALTAIASFVSPAYNFSITARLLRFVMMAFAATTGLFGVLFFSSVLIIHLCSLESMSKPYFYPFAPFHIKSQQDTIFRLPLWINESKLFNKFISLTSNKE